MVNQLSGALVFFWKSGLRHSGSAERKDEYKKGQNGDGKMGVFVFFGRSHDLALRWGVEMT